ncbi:MAG: hypothetical protein P8L68_19120 [Paracoccaceae bacterium]|nr:hypothetical protein [Paracoccaceae bacterium]
MNTLSAFDDKYWNLAQACAWIEYREKHLVEELAQADRTSYIAIGFYPSMWPPRRKQLGQIEELRRALEESRLISSGFRQGRLERLEDIPAAEWADYIIRPPFISFSDQAQNIPWEGVRILSADMRRLWRSVNEVDARSKFNWAAIQEIFDEVITQNPEMTKNELIIEVQGAFEDRFNKPAPSRSTLQRKIKAWS